MQRAAFLVFLTLLTFDVSGLAAICGDPPCDESCPTDVSGGQCAPNCHFCSCCSLPKAMGAAVVVLAAPPSREASWIQSNDRPASPEPADIFHVPIAPLA